MIDLKGKNKYVIPAIEAAGHIVETRNFVQYSSDDAAVQAIIDAYDALPEAKIDKIAELKLEGLKRANLVYDPDDDVFPSVASIKLLIDIDDTYTRIGAPAARLVSVNQVINEFEKVRDDINALTVLTDIETYDVVNTPAWP